MISQMKKPVPYRTSALAPDEPAHVHQKISEVWNTDTEVHMATPLPGGWLRRGWSDAQGVIPLHNIEAYPFYDIRHAHPPYAILNSPPLSDRLALLSIIILFVHLQRLCVESFALAGIKG